MLERVAFPGDRQDPRVVENAIEQCRRQRGFLGKGGMPSAKTSGVEICLLCELSGFRQLRRATCARVGQAASGCANPVAPPFLATNHMAATACKEVQEAKHCAWRWSGAMLAAVRLAPGGRRGTRLPPRITCSGSRWATGKPTRSTTSIAR